MSGGNVGFDLVNQIGNTQIDLQLFPDTPITIKDCALTPDEIASSILNDILENALDIATRSSDTEVQKYEETLKKSLAIKTEMSKSITKETDKMFIPDSVGDITTSCPLRINPSDGISIVEKKEEDIESQHPPPENFTKDFKLLPKKHHGEKLERSTIEGLGDHDLSQGKYDEKEACPLPRMVEKKSRLTDLVKNSRQVISEYLKADEETKKKQDEWERMQESVLRVIELECVKPGEEPKIQEKYHPESLALPEANDDEIINIPLPEEQHLEDVDLNRASTSHEGKADDIVGDVCTRMSCPRKQKELTAQNTSSVNLKKEKKKKSVFSKVINFFKKGKSNTPKDIVENKE